MSTSVIPLLISVSSWTCFCASRCGAKAERQVERAKIHSNHQKSHARPPARPYCCLILQMLVAYEQLAPWRVWMRAV
eukprot:SAG11_NODE_17957_length_504_cov_1.059259_1_plen_76_part_10